MFGDKRPSEALQGNTNRRSFLTKSAVGFGSVAGMTRVASIVGAASDGDSGTSAEEGQTEIDAQQLQVGDQLETFDWLILVGSEKKRLADRTIEYIEKSDVNDEYRQQAKENVKQLWREVDVSITERNGVETYELENPIETELAVREYKNRGFSEAEKSSTANSTAASETGFYSVIDSGIRQHFDEGTVTPQWNYNDDHRLLAYWAGKNMGLEEDSCNTLAESSVKPDTEWDYDFPLHVIDPVFGKIYEAPEKVAHAFAHSYHPDLDRPIGWANNFARKEMQKAVDKSGKDANQHLGYALHFLSDLGNPLHTGAFRQQVGKQQLHYLYENSVDDRLLKNSHDERRVPGELFRDEIAHLDGWVPVSSDSLLTNKYEDHAESLAGRSNDYSPRVMELLYTHEDSPNVIADSNELGDITEKLLHKTMQFMMGYVKEVR